MKKIMTFAVCVLIAGATFAQDQEKNSLKKDASNPAIQEVLSEPDGVSIVRNESDGSLKIYARGTASYDFGDARDIRDTTKVAELKAKAALSKYLTEIVRHKESVIEVSGNLSRTVLTEGPDGSFMKKNVSREDSRNIQETISAHSASILTGVVVLKTVKIPTEGSKTSGAIQVTVGISTKTLAAATEAHNMITDSHNARREIRALASKAGGNRATVNGGDESGKANGANPNKPEVRVNNTLF